MNTVRKIRSDTVYGLVAAHGEAQKPPPLTWPSDVNLPEVKSELDKALLIFTEVQSGRSRSHWKPHHARQAAEYSLLTLHIDKLLLAVAKNGPVIEGRGGHAMRSPLLDAMSVLTAQRNQVAKSLGLSGQRAEADHSGNVEAAARTTYQSDGLLAGSEGLI